MQKDEKEKYEGWKPSWEAQISEAEDQLLELTNEMRTSAVHRGRIETISRLEEVQVPIEPDPYQPHTHRAFLSQLKGGGPWTMREAHFVGSDGTERQITTVCEQYVEFLEKLVNDFVAKHPE